MLNFFKKPGLGLDVSDYSIKIISLGGSPDNSRLLAMGRIVLEPGVVQDGKILNKEILKKALSRLIESPKFGKIKTGKFIFSLPESKSFVLNFKLPGDLKEKEQTDFIKSEACQIIPFSPEELYSDFKILKIGDLKEALLVAAPKNVVNDYLEVFKILKFCPLAIDIESFALARALIYDREPKLIIDIGARTTNFSIFDEKELRFSYTIDIAGNTFTKSLAEGFKILLSEAESFKKEAGLNPEIKKGKSFFILQKEIQAIVLEIRNINKYFQSKANKEIKQIILAGGSALLPFLPEYLNGNLNKPVVVGDPWLKINIDILKKKEYFKEALEINPILYAGCVGSALRGLAKDPKRAGINLLNYPQLSF